MTTNICKIWKRSPHLKAFNHNMTTVNQLFLNPCNVDVLIPTKLLLHVLQEESEVNKLMIQTINCSKCDQNAFFCQR